MSNARVYPGRGSSAALRLSALPPAILETAALRIQWIAVACAVSGTVMTIVQHALQPDFAPAMIGGVSVAVGASLWLVAARQLGWAPAAPIVRVGPAYEVLVGFCIAFTEYSAAWDTSEPVRGVSWIAPWIALCTLLIPNRPRNVLIAALATASMEIAGYFAAHAVFPNPPFPASRLLVSALPAFVVAVGSAIINRKLYQLELEVHHARKMGSYQLEELLGKGGMGEVWRATHGVLAREAAIKIIQPDALRAANARQAERMKLRFGMEAKATAALESPHTVKLYDFGVSEDGSFYYVMELLHGIDLEDLVTRFGPAPPGRVVHILRQVCDSLAEAHGRGLIHRDIKPANVVVCRMGVQFDFTKVLDFGLVKTALADPSGSMTTEGATPRSPAYMAPEVISARPGVDGRADIYGLGCLAYWLLTGTLVFDRKSPAAVLVAHLDEQPERPSKRAKQPIPADLEEIVMRCLEKDPGDRPRSAAALAEMLEACEARWPRQDSQRWWREEYASGGKQASAFPERSLSSGSVYSGQPATVSNAAPGRAI